MISLVNKTICTQDKRKMAANQQILSINARLMKERQELIEEKEDLLEEYENADVSDYEKEIEVLDRKLDLLTQYFNAEDSLEILMYAIKVNEFPHVKMHEVLEYIDEYSDLLEELEDKILAFDEPSFNLRCEGQQDASFKLRCEGCRTNQPNQLAHSCLEDEKIEYETDWMDKSHPNYIQESKCSPLNIQSSQESLMAFRY